mmetsp:Transcript_15891/g.47234  ORF Transcript_15891/g.47234 Transcript_15891/m.47234 type:complete len:274 (+) Transcript_15891:1331-2152(+)
MDARRRPPERRHHDGDLAQRKIHRDGRRKRRGAGLGDTNTAHAAALQGAQDRHHQPRGGQQRRSRLLLVARSLDPLLGPGARCTHHRARPAHRRDQRYRAPPRRHAADLGRAGEERRRVGCPTARASPADPARRGAAHRGALRGRLALCNRWRGPQAEALGHGHGGAARRVRRPLGGRPIDRVGARREAARLVRRRRQHPRVECVLRHAPAAQAPSVGGPGCWGAVRGGGVDGGLWRPCRGHGASVLPGAAGCRRSSWSGPTSAVVKWVDARL